MANRRRHVAGQASRRGGFRMTSFQALIVVCCIAAFTICLLWYSEQKKLTAPHDHGVRGSSREGRRAWPGDGSNDGRGRTGSVDYRPPDGIPLEENIAKVPSGEDKSNLTGESRSQQNEEAKKQGAGGGTGGSAGGGGNAESVDDDAGGVDKSEGDEQFRSDDSGDAGWRPRQSVALDGAYENGDGNSDAGGQAEGKNALETNLTAPSDDSGEGDDGDGDTGSESGDVREEGRWGAGEESDDQDDHKHVLLAPSREDEELELPMIQNKEDADRLRRLQRKKRLNDLVAASVEKAEGRERNIAFVKTHKTASTTLTAVLYRYGLRHGLRVARFDVEGTAVTLSHAAGQTQARGKRVDIFHYHHVWDGFYKGTWGEARSLFGEIMAEPASSIKYLTVLRDPIEHWLSYYYFYFQPETKLGVDEYFSTGRAKHRPLTNPLAAEFGIYNKQALDDFILNHLPTFTLAMFTENVDEGLVLLGKILGCDHIDLTYASLLETGDGFMRWDDKPVIKAPKPKELSEETFAEVMRVTNLDAILYSAAKEHYDKIKESYSDNIDEEVREFRELQSEVLAYLDEGPRDSPARAWYMPESDYYFYNADQNNWWREDYPPPLQF